MRKSEALTRAVTDKKDMTVEQIPALDLYMDQVLQLFEGEGDGALTKSMINNYRKEGLITPPNGKRYSKYHIVEMLVIQKLKTTLRIGEIGDVLRRSYVSATGDNALLMAYQSYLDKRHQLDVQVEGLLTQVVDDAAFTDSTRRLETLLCLAHIASSFARAAEELAGDK